MQYGEHNYYNAEGLESDQQPDCMDIDNVGNWRLLSFQCHLTLQSANLFYQL